MIGTVGGSYRSTFFESGDGDRIRGGALRPGFEDLRPKKAHEDDRGAESEERTG
jgi:hypothetical protein